MTSQTNTTNTTTAPSRRIVIAGGSGFLGRGLCGPLLERDYAVTVLGRSVTRPMGLPESVDYLTWDAKTLDGDWAPCLDGAAAVINFVGRSVDCRKTEANKREILASRIDSCRVLGEAMRKVAAPPTVWVQSATAHIVGDPEPRDTICDDHTPPGPGYEMAPRVGKAWEQAFNDAKLPQQRGVALRISFVLGRAGGAMRRLTKITKLGLGGTVGPGDQWISWIHQEDLNRLILAALTDESYQGVYMATAPNPVTNRQFMKRLRKALRRPWSPLAPTFAVKLASRWLMNTDPELALLGRRCVPTRLVEEAGFTFAFPNLEEAFADLFGRSC